MDVWGSLARRSGRRGARRKVGDSRRPRRARRTVDRSTRRTARTRKPEGDDRRILAFAGHRLDAMGRARPSRFPESSVRLATEMIENAISGVVRSKPPAKWLAIAGGASGGDLLFHEACDKLGLRSEVLLARRKDAYVRESVADGGPGWVRRFRWVCATRRVRVLDAKKDITKRRRARPESRWEANSRWLLERAVENGVRRAVLIALWNGANDEGPGGTADTVERARSMGIDLVVLDARRLVAG